MGQTRAVRGRGADQYLRFDGDLSAATLPGKLKIGSGKIGDRIQETGDGRNDIGRRLAFFRSRSIALVPGVQPLGSDRHRKAAKQEKTDCSKESLLIEAVLLPVGSLQPVNESLRRRFLAPWKDHRQRAKNRNRRLFPVAPAV